MPSSTEPPRPAYGQRWDWDSDAFVSRLMLLCPTNLPGVWEVLFLHDDGSVGIAKMSGLYPDRAPLDGYTYIEG